MSRLPFDPKRMAAAERAESPSTGAAAPVTVSQLAVLVNRALKDCLPATVRVIGEISQFRERTHWYFDLKDAGAVMSCVMFASSARRAGFVPTVGQQVVLSGRVEFWDKGGRTQFMADRMEPVGAGALDLAFRKLCEEMRAMGWFDEARKRPLPLLPARVAVVTSRTGAALQDVLDTARRRNPSVVISLVDVRVQGEGAAAQVAAAIRRLGRLHEHLAVDVVLVTRGGGSMEDLWAFNEREVAEAIIGCPIPVVAAIGHETDTTIAELVADLRCATPTQAAMRIIPDRSALRLQLRSLTDRLGLQVNRHLRIERERLRGLMRHPVLASPERLIDVRRSTLKRLARDLSREGRQGVRERLLALNRVSARLERHRPDAVYARREARLRHAETALVAAMRSRLLAIDLSAAARELASAMRTGMERRQAAMQSAARGLDLVGPHGVLRRGFSITMDASGRTIRSVNDVAAGSALTTRVMDGEFGSIVTGAGASPAPSWTELSPMRARSAAERKMTRRVAVDPNQLDLFGLGSGCGGPTPSAGEQSGRA